MNEIALHPFHEDDALHLIREQWAAVPQRTLASLRDGRESAANDISAALALALAERTPPVLTPDLGLTGWEAMVDRGLGMYLRPPARLFTDAGIPQTDVAAMPIRLDAQGGMMAGAWVPARLVPAVADVLDARLERIAKRLADAERDPFALIGAMELAVRYARQHELALLESTQVIVPPMAVILPPERKKMDAALRDRIQIAIEGEKKPGIFSRLLGRG